MNGVPLYIKLQGSELGVVDPKTRDYATYEKSLNLLLENTSGEINVGADFNEGDVLRLKCLTTDTEDASIEYTTITNNTHLIKITSSDEEYSYFDLYVGSFIKKLSVNEKVSVYQLELGSVQDLKNEMDVPPDWNDIINRPFRRTVLHEEELLSEQTFTFREDSDGLFPHCYFCDIPISYNYIREGDSIIVTFDGELYEYSVEKNDSYIYIGEKALLDGFNVEEDGELPYYSFVLALEIDEEGHPKSISRLYTVDSTTEHSIKIIKVVEEIVKLPKKYLPEIEDKEARKSIKELRNTIPTKTSGLENDSNFQNETQVNALINSAISAQTHWRFEKVDKLPSIGVENTIYLVPNSKSGENIYDEYIYISSEDKFEVIGSTAIELSKYYLKTETYSQEEVDALIKAVSDAVATLQSKIPTKTSHITNDSGFIDKTVNNLVNYYLKSETYSQEEIDAKLSLIPKFSIQPVDSLPTTDISTTTVYLLKSGEETQNLYTEYIYVNNTWEYLGTQTVDLSGYALKTEIPTKLSALTNDAGFITNTVNDLVNYYKKSEVYNKNEIDAKGFLTQHQSLEGYAKKEEIPTKTSQLSNDSNFATTDAIPTKPNQVGADPSGTAESKVSEHNVSETAHNDLRLLIEGLATRLNTLANSDDTTLDQMAEVVAYIKNNKSLIDGITTNKVNVADIIDNLTTSVANKPLSAKQGVLLKTLVDDLDELLSGHMPDTSIHVTSAEKEAWNDAKNELNQFKYLNNYVTPQMYGAKADGTTDDTQAFKDALSENNVLYLPSGDYLISDTLDICYKKAIFSNDGQKATLHFNHESKSVVSLGRMSIFRNINITMKKAYSGKLFDTNNYDKNSGEGGLGSRIEHIDIDFEVYSPNATLIGITVDSGTDANNMPRLKGLCFQTYNDIVVDNSSEAYGYGIKMELIQGRPFTEETKDGFPWITHINFNDISLGHPHTAIKSLVTNTSGSELFERVNIGHILFNNVYSQCLYNETTRYFLDLAHIGCYITKCIPWDYHNFVWNGEKVNIIGEGVNACISDCSMATGAEFLKTCEFTAETEYDVNDNPEYFISKYFNGSVLSEGYDSIDAKIDAKLTGEYVASVSEKKINEILYSGYSNIMDDPLTQIKFRQRWSGSSNTWVEQTDMVHITTVIIPIVQGGNIIRWSEPNVGNPQNDYATFYFFNDDGLETAVGTVGTYADNWVSDGGYLQVDNPNGYKYVSIPFCSSYFDDSELENMVMTINREITGNDGQSFTEYLNENVITPAVASKVDEEVKKLSIPTKTSQLTNDSGFLTEHQSLADYAKTTNHYTKTETDNKFQPKGNYLTQHQDISGKVDKTETLTLVGVDVDDNTHTWIIYGEVVS